MASLMVPDNPTEIVQRPDAPCDLTDEQSEEWRAVVSTMPPDHFMRGNYALLSQLCRHVVSARRIAQLIEQCAKEKNLDRKELGCPAPTPGYRECSYYSSHALDETDPAICHEGRDNKASKRTREKPVGSRVKTKSEQQEVDPGDQSDNCERAK
jgi:hypothetical protein